MTSDSGSKSIFLIWIPSLIGVICLVTVWNTRGPDFYQSPLLIAAFIPGYLLIITLVMLIRKQWALLRSAFLMAVVTGCGFSAVILYSLDEAISTPTGNKLPTRLSLPEGITLENPDPQPASTTPASDAFQTAISNALRTPASKIASFTADVSNFQFLAQNHPDLLINYLSASPDWRVFSERGSRYATRRWKTDSGWHYVRHGYYSNHDISHGSEAFKTRFTIGLDGVPWVGNLGGATKVKNRETIHPGNHITGGLNESHCVIEVGPMTIECYEQSRGKERRITKASFAVFESELQPLAASPHRDTFVDRLPTDSILESRPIFNLHGSKGNYRSEIRINPGAPGTIYLKAFEITTGKPLSKRKLKTRTNERTGWSSDPSQTFLSNTTFTIFEGQPNHPFGARFEIWFLPDSGQPERKLLEKQFKIEGNAR